jgi:leucyl aminopeptidase
MDDWTGWNPIWSVANDERETIAQAEGKTDAIVVLLYPEMLADSIVLVHPALDEAARDQFRRGTFGARPGDTLIVPSAGLLPGLYVIYAGYDPDDAETKSIRRTAGAIGKALAAWKLEKIRWRIPAAWLSARGAAAAAEGLLLSAYGRNARKAEKRSLPSFRIVFELPDQAAVPLWHEGFDQGVKVANAVCYARELTNLPGNVLTPARFALEAEKLAERSGLSCKIYDEVEAAQLGMGGLLAVGKGSANPPRMIVLRYEGAPDASAWTGLVGKGVTFDAGGISLKPGKGMEEFISDMGGAAAVFGVMQGLASLRLPVNVVGVVPAVENLPSGSAYKPGDVIETYSGLTVEVLNTDAEGRIVLADGLTVAIREGADRLIDVATLTGAVMHALGDITTGAIANDQQWLNAVLEAGERAGEYIWPLPAHPEYRNLLKSDVADLKNHGGQWAGAIAGGLFVGAFAEDRPWVHLDIGGTAWMWEDRPLEPKGGTGVMVRTLLELFRQQSGKAIS